MQAWGHSMGELRVVLRRLAPPTSRMPMTPPMHRTAAFLPWLPGRAFSMKGAWLGGALALVAATLDWGVAGLFANDLAAVAWLVMIPSLSSFLALNFTGATPITSLSGVRAEMRRAIPIHVLGAAVGLALWIAALFL